MWQIGRHFRRHPHILFRSVVTILVSSIRTTAVPFSVSSILSVPHKRPSKARRVSPTTVTYLLPASPSWPAYTPLRSKVSFQQSKLSYTSLVSGSPVLCSCGAMLLTTVPILDSQTECWTSPLVYIAADSDLIALTHLGAYLGRLQHLRIVDNSRMYVT